MENSEFTIIVNKYYQQIINDKPTFIQTKNSFERKCVYTALEQINTNLKLKISCNRNKIIIKPIANATMCQKHFKSLSGSCDDCTDPFCGGPYCEDCSLYDYCRHAIEIGDEMYSSKIINGINLYYDDKVTNIKYKKLGYL